jgi:vacuolar-type H+-ATPase subunit E/Vma4
VDIQVILDEIERTCKQQINKIDEDAKFHISRDNLNARKDAEKQEERILTDGRMRLNRAQALINQQAVVRTLQIHADARQTLIRDVLNQAKQNLSQIRKRKDYPLIPDHLVDESLKTLTPSLLEGQKIIIHFDKEDKELAEQILKKMDLMAQSKYDIKCAGGCIAESEDHLVSVMNSMESRFERATAFLQQKLSIFFEGKTASV